MKKVIVCGGCGKMASIIARNVYTDNNLKLVGIVEALNFPSLGNDWGNFMGLGSVDIKIESNLEDIIDKSDVVVDFTNPEATMEHLKICLEHKKALVVGTTGLSEKEVLEIEEASSNIPVVFSPNMSLGVNLLFELVRKVSMVLDDEYDVEIIETHHRYKKDAPSGTAKKIAEIIAHEKKVSLDKNAVYGRHGNDCQRKKSEIGIHAVRAGNISGEHTIIFNSSGERLELTHRAYSREAFAQGTIKAIYFIANQQKGLFNMKEVLDL